MVEFKGVSVVDVQPSKNALNQKGGNKLEDKDRIHSTVPLEIKNKEQKVCGSARKSASCSTVRTRNRGNKEEKSMT